MAHLPSRHSCGRNPGVMAIVVTAVGCSESVTAPLPAAPASLVQEIVTTVYLLTFDSLDARCARLAGALDALATAPTQSTLSAAQQAWRDAREPYEQNEGFAFGPIESGGFDPRMDTWPIDVAGIDALLASDNALDQSAIDQLDGTLKGFHGVEYVLFGFGGHTTPESLTPRARDYLRGAGGALADAAHGLRTAWQPSGGDFAGQLSTAGEPGSLYPTIGAALSEVVAGMTEPTDEVPNSKIAPPLSSGSADYAESRFSDNTLADLRNDLEGMRKVYYGGDTQTPGQGVSAFVAAQSPALDADVRAGIERSLAALDAVGPSFNTALTSDPGALRAAQSAILDLNRTLVNSVIPLVGGGGDDD